MASCLAIDLDFKLGAALVIRLAVELGVGLAIDL